MTMVYIHSNTPDSRHCLASKNARLMTATFLKEHASEKNASVFILLTWVIHLLVPRLRRARLYLAFETLQQLSDNVDDIHRLKDGIEAERTALVALHVMSGRRIFWRGNLTELVRLDGVSDKEERGDEGHFAGEDERGEAVGQIIEGEVFAGV